MAHKALNKCLHKLWDKGLTLEGGSLMEQYTEGDWKVSKSALGEWYISTDETLIASQVRHFNAHLISASPDLYEASKELANFVSGLSLDSADCEKRRYVIHIYVQAIAKAEVSSLEGGG